MTKGVKDAGKPGRKLPNEEVVELALREMKKAVPEIERRVLERDALAAESRFEAPRTSDIAKRNDD
ncbi:MAG: hypothetical protein OXQ29_27435 [Rhodospirillaceae bacterium]|nr:hypothetical protein [Rhodospirillaceae bacterium]